MYNGICAAVFSISPWIPEKLVTVMEIAICFCYGDGDAFLISRGCYDWLSLSIPIQDVRYIFTYIMHVIISNKIINFVLLAISEVLSKVTKPFLLLVSDRATVASAPS